jgi:hypothetical protein
MRTPRGGIKVGNNAAFGAQPQGSAKKTPRNITETSGESIGGIDC